jgi:outer membrane protein OmpA-like peptidoglycan-associated protein
VYSSVFAQHAVAQQHSGQSSQSLRLTFGGYGAVNGNIHGANFKQLTGVPTSFENDPTRFESAFGLGYSFGGLVEVPISEIFSIQARVGFSALGAQLLAKERGRIGYVDSMQSIIRFRDAIFEKRMNAALGLITFEPLAVFAPFTRNTDALKGLRIYGGIRGGFMITRSFDQKELLTDPADPSALFNNMAQERNPQSGAIPNANALNMGVTLGVGYDIRAGDLLISPELFFTLGITPVTTDLAWGVSTGRLGVSLRYAPEVDVISSERNNSGVQGSDSTGGAISGGGASGTSGSGSGRTGADSSGVATSTPDSTAASTTATATPLQHTPTQFSNSEVNPSNTLSASIAAFSLDENGVEQPMVQFKVEQYVAQQMYPLMNYIFFDQGSSDVPEKYRRVRSSDTAAYDEQKFYNVNMLKVYYDVLNVIGKRLRLNPKARITLTGCNNNVGTEVGNVPLSFRRANNIKRYLIDTWGVDSTRITVRARNLPEKPTMSRDSLGIEENRRVEFLSDSWEIMKPVLVNDTIGIPLTPMVRFKMNTKADNGIAQSSLSAVQGGKVLKIFSLPRKPDSTMDWSPITDWETGSDQTAVPKTEEDLKFVFEVIDTKGEKVRPTGSIPVELITVQKKREAGSKDKEVAIFRLILFDFNSPAVGPTNATIIKQFVQPKLRDGSKIQVTGFTDKLGNPDVNMRLSGARAKSVADYIKWSNTTWKGVGGTRPIYPNDTPEGRIYSRSVEVRCEIPLGQ